MAQHEKKCAVKYGVITRLSQTKRPSFKYLELNQI